MRILGIIFGAILLLGIAFGMPFIKLAYYKYFTPKYENVKREVFEETKSYNHSKIQDLAKYYEEYSKADIDNRESIRQLIIMNFAEFDTNNIKNQKLKQFLINQRGY